jgi:hypothetical protein
MKSAWRAAIMFCTRSCFACTEWSKTSCRPSHFEFYLLGLWTSKFGGFFECCGVGRHRVGQVGTCAGTTFLLPIEIGSSGWLEIADICYRCRGEGYAIFLLMHPSQQWLTRFFPWCRRHHRDYNWWENLGSKTCVWSWQIRRRQWFLLSR